MESPLKASTKIGGYAVEYESEGESTGRPQCWINYGPYSGSLERLRQEGVLSDRYDHDLAVPQMHIAKIESWAKDQGYDH
jgi:hypothetical protein